jgi:prohibitin 1
MITSSSGTKDLQTVDIALRLLYRPIEDCLPKIYKNIGIDYENKIIPSIGNEVLKSVVAQYDADQLLKQRERISNEIREQLTSRAQ